MAAKEKPRDDVVKNDASKQSPSLLFGFQKQLSVDFNREYFEKALKGSQQDLTEFLEREKPLLFDYAMRMTGEVNRSWEAIQEQFLAVQKSHLKQCGSAFVFRQALFLGLRKELGNIWHRETSRLENAAYVMQVNPDTENLSAISKAPSSKARDFDREFHQLPGVEREALWLKARGLASFEEIAQIMSLTVAEVERILVHALFRLENKSFGFDPESLVAQLPFHPMPAPVSHVTMDLSQMMQGIKKSQKAPKTNRGLIFLGFFLVIACYVAYEGFLRAGKNWILIDLMTFFEKQEVHFLKHAPSEEKSSLENESENVNESFKGQEP